MARTRRSSTPPAPHVEPIGFAAPCPATVREGDRAGRPRDQPDASAMPVGPPDEIDEALGGSPRRFIRRRRRRGSPSSTAKRPARRPRRTAAAGSSRRCRRQRRAPRAQPAQPQASASRISSRQASSTNAASSNGRGGAANARAPCPGSIAATGRRSRIAGRCRRSPAAGRWTPENWTIFSLVRLIASTVSAMLSVTRKFSDASSDSVDVLVERRRAVEGDEELRAVIVGQAAPTAGRSRNSRSG